MGQNLKPLRTRTAVGYPKATSDGSLKGVLVAAAMTATSLGGCGPAIDSRSVNQVIDAGDLDAAVVNCVQTPNDPRCHDAGSVGGAAGAAGAGAGGAGPSGGGNTSQAGAGGHR
jgi:hypothetical protein